jgi:hypothetical protein
MDKARRPLLPRVADRLRRGANPRLTAVAGRLGYDIVLRDYYSPIPDLSDVPDAAWTTPSALGGVAWRLDEHMGFLERDLARFVAEFDPPRDPTSDPTAFFLRNGTYESVDAETLYAMIRYLRPTRVIELGSGRSTQVIAAARAANRADGVESSYQVVDPYPTALTRAISQGAFRLDEISATDVPIDRFAELRQDDVLFVDTTHTVKFLSDVNYVILDVLPVLAPGVVVHFHDVFLPMHYPRPWLEVSRWFWAEQYLLQAFLAFNSSFETLLPTHALSQPPYANRLAKVVPSFGPDVNPGAFWLRRT